MFFDEVWICIYDRMNEGVKHMNSEIEKLRQELDKIDNLIISQLNKRFKTTHQIGKIKKKYDLEIQQSSRETDIINRIRDKCKNSQFEDAIVRVYRYIMSISKDEQSKL